MFRSFNEKIDSNIERLSELALIERMDRQDKTIIQGYLVNETEKAAQFNIECFQGKFRTIWLPKSVITFYQNTFDKRIYDIIIPTWLAKSKKLF
jgi:hypothetical protein